MNLPAVVAAWLREDDAISDRLNDRVYTVLPKTTPEKPVALVSRIGGSPLIPDTVRLWEALIQVSVWADRKAEVADLSDLIVQALHDLPGRTYRGVHVSKVEFVSIVSDMDTSADPAVPRVLIRFYLNARAV